MKNTKHILFFLLLICVGINAQIPAGYYYLADGKKKAELKSYLSTIISQAQMLRYGSGAGYTWQGFYYTDRNTDNSVVDMYSSIERFFPENYGSINGMHIEHSLPKSWWGTRQNNAYKDLFHLYPADGTTNMTKSNLPMGEVASATFNNGKTKIGQNGFSYYLGKVFEPSDEFKGDFARSYLYMSVAYEYFGDNQHNYWNSPMINNNTYPVWQKWAIDLLLKWHRQDPVSAKERARQEQVFAIQGNRNPFIDHPELAEYIWGTDTNNVYHFPAETHPFMLQPNRWSKVDFGVAMQGDNVGAQLQVWGQHLSGNVNLAIKNASPMLSLSQSVITAAQANNSRTIQIWLDASVAGGILDTLVISGGGLANAIYVPILAVVSPDFMALKATDITSTTARLNWINLYGPIQNPISYTVKVYRQTAKSADLFFSGYVEGTSNNKALVIYNNTGQSVDLSKFSIKKQTNGEGSFKHELNLSGSLADGQKYVIVHSSANSTLQALADKIATAPSPQDNPLAFNGNDAMGLYHNSILIDVIGIENELNMWGEDLTLQRKSGIIHPTTDFLLDEWNVLPVDNFSPAQSHSVSTFSDQLLHEYSAGTDNSYLLRNLAPQTQYIYEVRTNNRAGGNLTSANRTVFRTIPLETPIAYEASDIREEEFTANWEDVESADGYYLNVYQVSEGEQQSETETFVGMSGSTLPNSWSGNTTYYTSAANSGQGIPAVSFNANTKWLQTKTYPAPVTELRFWYKFTSGASSKLIIWGNNGDEEWFELDTIYQQNTVEHDTVFNFDVEDNFTAFKFVLNKSSGNLAIDDVFAKYITYDTTYIVQNQDVANNNYTVKYLTLDETYFYRVKSYFQDLESGYSNQIAVKTQIPSAIPQIADNQAIIYETKDGIYINNINIGDRISVFAPTGILLYSQTANSNQISIPFSQNGIFIVMIKSDKNYFVQKIVK